MLKSLLTLNQKLIFLLLILLSIPAILPLFNEGFFLPHDNIFVARIFAMSEGLKDGQFPVRWTGNFRYGEPLFNFYAPLPYYIGSLISFLGLSFIDVAKILLGSSVVFSGLSMFLLGNRLFGKFSGLLAAVLYMYAPYHAVDIYVRGALSESWSLIFFPLIFLFIYNLANQKNFKDFLFLTLSFVGLFLTHNIMTLLFAPFVTGWILIIFILKRNLEFLLLTVGSIILATGISAFFLFPAFLERNLVQSGKLTSGHFDYRAHFVGLRQFVIPSWGYGASLWGPIDDMSFQIGPVHLGGLIVVGISSCLGLIRFKRLWFLEQSEQVSVSRASQVDQESQLIGSHSKTISLIIIFLGFEFLLSLFMMHNKSQFIWDSLPILSFTQFPWRFLGVSIFLASFLSGALFFYFKRKALYLLAPLIVITIIINANYFKPEKFVYINDDYFISSDKLSKGGDLPADYVPIWAKLIDNSHEINKPTTNESFLKVSDFNQSSVSTSFKAGVDKDEVSGVIVPVAYFPGWKVYVDGVEIEQNEPTITGLINFKLPQGNHDVSLKFENTPVRNISNMISLVSVIILLGLTVKKLKFK